MLHELSRALAHSNADYCDVRIEETRTMKIVLAKDSIEEVASNFIAGGNVRALVDGGIAYRAFTNIESLGDALARAERAAAIMGRTAKVREGLAPAPVVKDRVFPSPNIDPRKISFEEKKALIEEYNSLIIKHPKVQTTSISYFERFTKEFFVNSEGTEIEQEILLCRIGGRIITKDGSRVEMASFSLGYDCDYGKLLNRHDVVEKQTKIALDLLNAHPPRPGVYTIICDWELGGVFAHEAFGHLGESDDQVNNPPLHELMKLGSVFGRPILNIVDQGNFPGAPGTYAYDHEGVATRKTYLVKEGVLVGRLASRNSAFRLGGEPTGNYRAADYRVNPIVRMSNIYIEGGQTSFEEMLERLDNGLYLCAGKGGQTMGDLFTFGAQHGYEVKNGRLGKMICDVNISGNVFETLRNIVAIGNDFRMSEWGGCGKSRTALYELQMIDKSGIGSPHLLIENVVVGGRE